MKTFNKILTTIAITATLLLTQGCDMLDKKPTPKVEDPMLKKSLLCTATVQYLISESEGGVSLQDYRLSQSWRNEFISQLAKVTEGSSSTVILKADSLIFKATVNLSNYLENYSSGRSTSAWREAHKILNKDCGV